MLQLPIEHVRETARRCGLEEIYLNENSRVISFRSLSNKRTYVDSSSSASQKTRYNVYYTTGTVSTSLDHPRQGKTQLFRRNVSLDLLEEIFLNPRIHTDLGYKYRNEIPYNNNKRAKGILKNSHHDNDYPPDLVEGEEDAAKRQMTKLIAERRAIDKEIHEVQAILDEHERVRELQRQIEREIEKIQRKAAEAARKAAEEARKEALRTARGNGGTWRGLIESKDFKNNFTSHTTCIAIGDNTHLCLYENGGWAYSSGLMKGVLDKLRTRSLSHPSPKYIAMGSRDRYYIRFANGKSEWVGPSNMTDLLQNTSREVRSVAFGEDFDDYFIVFEDGGYNYCGAPSGLESKINARRKRGDLDKVSLGPNGEWFLSAKNGRAWWEGASDLFYSDVREVMNEGGDITDIQFGESGTWFIRYK